MPEKGAGVSLKDFSRGSVVEGQGGRRWCGAGEGRSQTGTPERRARVQACGLIRPCRTCPGKEQPADQKKTGKAAAFPVRPEREVRGSALKGVAGGLKGLVRQFGLLLEQLPDAPVRDAVPAGQKAHLGIAGGTGGGMAAEGAEQLPLAHLTGETGAAGDNRQVPP